MIITPSAPNRIITNSLSHLFVKCRITDVLWVYKLPLCYTLLMLYCISFIYSSICIRLSVLLCKLLLYVYAFILPQLLCFVSYILLCIQFLTLIMYFLFPLIIIILYCRYHTHHNTPYLFITSISILSLFCFFTQYLPQCQHSCIVPFQHYHSIVISFSRLP